MIGRGRRSSQREKADELDSPRMESLSRRDFGRIIGAILQMAHAFEQATQHGKRRPALVQMR